jgi:hypothetical protein
MFSVSNATRPEYYKYLAKLYFEAAEAADKSVGQCPGYEMSAPPPVMTLCAHSIELSLKAYLLDNGVDETSVRNLKHDLVACWDLCISYGADPNIINRTILVIITDLLRSGRLRYGDQPKLGKVPVYGPLSDLCRSCLKLCGAPSLADCPSSYKLGHRSGLSIGGSGSLV